ncbi:MAG: hypothetical protein LBL23_05545 [Coriobacteriales bacterium]|jgi:hypothetical protein|nr:hypothetical protein [Coriobacteriales bacterium]
MAQSNLAYRQEAEAERYDALPIRSPRPALRTIEGTRSRAEAEPRTAPWVRTLVVSCAVVLLVVATVSVARISIANATVQMMQTAEQTSAAIEQARAVGLELEVQHSLANNPTRIQDNAAVLHILPAGQPATVQARNGFSAETLDQMQRAAEEARAAEIASMQGSEAGESHE